MKIVIAPDSFKGCMTAQQAAQAIAEGVRKAIPDAQLELVPMADGGEGTVQSLVDATGGSFITVTVTGPLGAPVEARYGLLGNGETAVIEMAAASGINFVDERTRNPLVTTTYGTGELVKDALSRGVTQIIVGLGGSATNDGGAGMAQALGVRLLDADGNELPFGGAALANLAAIDTSHIDSRLQNVEMLLASDVTNPLTGERGASAVFGPQKGATPQMVQQLDAALHHYAQIIERDTGKSVENIPGAGAAGGLGAGFLAFTNAQMRSGISLVVEVTHLKERARDAAYCFTGEGGIDAQTHYGKTPMGVAQAVKESAPDCTVIALAGNVGEGTDVLYGDGIDAILGIVPGAVTLSDALAHGRENLERTAQNVARIIARQ